VNLPIIEKDMIQLNVSFSSKQDVFHTLSKLLENKKRISNLDSFVEDLWKREFLGSTGFGEGLAIPHAKSSFVKVPSVVFARLSSGLDYQSIDNSLVTLIFLIAVPEGKTNLHLEMLSKIAKLLHDKSTRERMKVTDSKEEILSILDELNK